MAMHKFASIPKLIYKSHTFDNIHTFIANQEDKSTQFFEMFLKNMIIIFDKHYGKIQLH